VQVTALFLSSLAHKVLQHMDVFSGAKRRHIFSGIMRVFRVEYAILALTTAAQVGFNFLVTISPFPLATTYCLDRALLESTDYSSLRLSNPPN
jgi:hypothetical protein